MSITMVTTTAWEDLRKQARRIENEIDSKLVSYNKLGANLAKNDQYSASTSGERSSLLSSNDNIESVTSELEANLTRLTQINDQMNNYANQASSTGTTNPALSHTLNRHRDILHDYNNEFVRTRNAIQQRIDRHNLLHNEDDQTFIGQQNVNNRRGEGLLKENMHINNSHRHLDEQIAIAIATKENITQQRGGLKDISKKIQTITKRYPALNSLMQKIQIKKRRDTIVIAAVISICLILMFLYISG